MARAKEAVRSLSAHSGTEVAMRTREDPLRRRKSVDDALITKPPTMGLAQYLAGTRAIGVALGASIALTGVLALLIWGRRQRVADGTTAEVQMVPQPVVY